jgi:hypothetical protein
MLVYGLQYSDKGSLASGVVFGLRKDTHLVGGQYANLTVWFCEHSDLVARCRVLTLTRRGVSCGTSADAVPTSARTYR